MPDHHDELPGAWLPTHSGGESGGMRGAHSAVEWGMFMEEHGTSGLPGETSRRRWIRRVLYLLLLAAGVAFYARLRTFSAPSQLELGGTEFQRLDGSAMPPGILEGKAVVLNFWAPWCPPCRVEMPWLDDLQKSDPGIVVLGVEDDPDEYTHAVEFARRKAITYPLVRFSPELDRKLGGIHTLPTTLFISRSGRVVHAVRGAIPEVVMRRFAQDAERTP